MAQRQVVEVQCTRCDRKEYREPKPDLMTLENEEKRTRAFDATLYVAGEYATVFFDDLCSPCASTIKGHLEAIGKKIEGVSPVREKKAKPPAPPRGKLDVQTGVDGELPYNGAGAKKKGPHASTA